MNQIRQKCLCANCFIPPWKKAPLHLNTRSLVTRSIPHRPPEIFAVVTREKAEGWSVTPSSPPVIQCGLHPSPIPSHTATVFVAISTSPSKLKPAITPRPFSYPLSVRSLKWIFICLHLTNPNWGVSQMKQVGDWLVETIVGLSYFLKQREKTL